MSRLSLCAAALSVCVLASAARGDPPPPAALAEAPTSVEAARDLQARAMQAQRNQDIDLARRLLAALRASPGFALLTNDERRMTVRLSAFAERRADNTREAHSLAKEAAAMAGASEDDWHLRLVTALEDRDTDDAALTLATLAKRFPDTLDRAGAIRIFRLLEDARSLPDGGERRFTLLSTLFDAHWSPTGARSDPSALWRELATDLVGRGDLKRAAAAAQAVREPSEIAIMAADLGFAPLVARRPELFDLAKAMERRLKQLQADANDSPQSLEAANAYAYALMQSGRDAEALALYDQMLAAALPRGGGRSTYADAEDNVNWTMDGRHQALAHLGRWEEAIAQQEQASLRREDGRVNASQTLNLAGLYVEAGRPAAAIALLAGFSLKDASPYGDMVAEWARAAAYDQLGDKAGVARSLAYARDHKKDSARLLEDILWIAGETDEAVRLHVERLHDPDLRGEALSELQRWRQAPVQSAAQRKAAAQTEELRNRPEIQAALAGVGRILDIPFYGP